MPINIKSILFSATILLCQNAFSQEFCGTDRFLKPLLESNPKAKEAFDLRVSKMQEAQNVNPKSVQAGVRIIPVVFHVIHNYGSENIAKAVIDETIDIMNQDWRKNNQFISSITSNFAGIATDCQVEFRLATKDPNGNCTQGVTRHASPLTVNASDNVKAIVDWPNTKYLNIWVVKSISEGVSNSGGGITLGYAYFPDVMNWNPAIDGIIVRSDAMGAGSYRAGRTLSHEVGHYLGLAHTFQGSCTDNGDDVNDTPPENGTAYFDCDYNYNPCGSSLPANIENFMSYASCQKMFTAGQKQIVDQTFSQSRNILVSSNNLIATGTQNALSVDCKPVADFMASNIVLCQGESVNFSDLSYNGVSTSWNWTFSGGTPNTSTEQNPSVTYNQPGNYAVSLTSSNASGQNTLNKTQYLSVIGSLADNNIPPFSEGFEGNPVANNLWTIVNPDNDLTWSESSVSAASGSRSLRLLNSSNNTAGEIDAVISNTYNFSAIQNLEFKFKVAFKQKATANTDALKVFFSTNCGKSWTVRYSKQGQALATTTAVGAGNFIPTSSQWREETVTLNAPIKNSSNVRFKFEFTSGGGNNIYLDDINISGTVGIKENNFEIKPLPLVLSPNPATQNCDLSFYAISIGDYQVLAFDVLGKLVLQQNVKVHNLGNQHFEFSKGNFTANGLYFIKVLGKNFVGTSKLVWE